jgi:hypothetical protein
VDLNPVSEPAQSAKTAKRKFAKKPKTKFYHASPKRFHPGDILIPAIETGKGNYGYGELPYVYLATSPIPHHTIWPDIKVDKEPWFVYEVEPLDKVYTGEWDELITRRAKIVKFIGNAQGLMNRKMRTYKEKESKPKRLPGGERFTPWTDPNPPGSMVSPQDVNPPAGVKIRGRGKQTHWDPKVWGKMGK